MSKTKIIILSLGLIILVSGGLLMWVSSKNKENLPISAPIKSNLNQNTAGGKIQALDNQPRQVVGVVETIDEEKLDLKQDATEEIRYEIKKDEVLTVSAWVNNETFDEKKYKELTESMPGLGDNISSAEDLTPEKVQEMNEKSVEVDKQLMTDPTLRAFSENSSDWTQIVKGSEIMVDVDSAGKKITILPTGFLAQTQE